MSYRIVVVDFEKKDT